MNKEKNRIPEGVKSIHLIAVCGTGMGSLACMLKESGFVVTGSDRNVYPPMSTFLKRKGIRVLEGYQEEHLAYGPDLVVVGNAVTKDNPEVRKMDQMGLYYCSMPQAINAFVTRDKKPILITGTHGKTTTSAIIAWLLQTAGLEPTFIIGGILADFDSSYRLAKGPHVVIEGDEYDTAFFDKEAKFFHYDPFITVLTSIEFDHADIFDDMRHVKRTFQRYISGLKPDSLLIANGEDPYVSTLIKSATCKIFAYGKQNGHDWTVENVSISPPQSILDVFQTGRYYDRFETTLMGNHNLANVLAAVAVADQLCIPKNIIRQALRSFKSVRRRQEVRGVRNNITVIDDFAHHPTAVRETISAVKSFYTQGCLIAVFEPRTNTSMRNVFQEIYPNAFQKADMVCIRKPPLLQKIPPDERFSSKKLVQDLKTRGQDAHYFEDTDSIIDFLSKQTKPGDVILIMSNGGFDNIHARLLEKL